MILLAILFVAIVMIAGAANSNRRSDLPPPLQPQSPSPTEFAAQDPVEALLRYGTPEDADRLARQGVDLGALGYRPPGE